MNKPTDSHWLELYEECAAIMEYDGGLSRQDAEQAALVEAYMGGVS